MDDVTVKWLCNYLKKYSRKATLYENRYEEHHVARDKQFANKYKKLANDIKIVLKNIEEWQE